ncbi:hypothetical protein [Chitinophaga sancti]|uniref:Uncharacterized protein n=1 Tax=Chitinophaga sancti TaxID=1004 RepID=A0A1K1PIW5_9BACT|nr:hypothetical protein [Chitinophaga sancti]WQD65879.1 hypothetical protein U0033_15865 [Chitinophaga sancti]WQG88499.1 hypothetical protein SR876_26605 [Chitinophaga sancti]SFW46590.1 hypothetical protein SAMN05661012_01944 [Chitinophaga sancti]
MTGRKITIDSAVIYMRKLQGTSHMRIRYKEDEFLLLREKGQEPAFETAPDLSEEALKKIIWAVEHYFPLRERDR